MNQTTIVALLILLLCVASQAQTGSPAAEEMRDKLNALGILSEMVVIPETPHPFWLFHPWFDTTVQDVDEFLKKTMPDGE